MSVIDNVEQVMHSIHVRLYPAHLPGQEDELIARTVNEKALSYEEVCVAAKERGGFTGSLEDLKDHTAIFLREAAYQLCDGFGVNFGGIFSVYPNVGGVFENERAPVNKDKHKVNFHFRALNSLRKIADRIEVISEGLADSGGYIVDIVDVTTGLMNDVVTKDGIFMLSGDKIRVVGAADKTGVYFFSPGSPDASIKVTANLAINDPSKIIGTVPELSPNKDWYVEVRTNFSGNTSILLKETRTIRSKFTVKQA